MTVASLGPPLKLQPNVYVIIFYYFYALWCKIIIIIITVIITGLRSSIKDAPARMESVARQTTDDSGEGEGRGGEWLSVYADARQFCSILADFKSYRQYILPPNNRLSWFLHVYCAAVTLIAACLQHSEESVCSGDDVSFAKIWSDSMQKRVNVHEFACNLWEIASVLYGMPIEFRITFSIPKRDNLQKRVGRCVPS